MNTKTLKNTISYSLVAVLALAIMFGTTSMAFAQENAEGGIFSELSVEQIEELKDIRLEGDKDAFEAKLIEFGIDPEYAKKAKKRRNFRKNLQEQLTDEQLEALKEARENGATHEEIKEKLEAYGFEMPGKEKIENREEIKIAIDEGDYETFSELTEGTKLEEYVDEDTFHAVAEARDLRESGDYEAAREVIEEVIDDENKSFFKRIWKKRKANQEDGETRPVDFEGEANKGLFGRIFGN